MTNMDPKAPLARDEEQALTRLDMLVERGGRMSAKERRSYRRLSVRAQYTRSGLRGDDVPQPDQTGERER